MDKDNFGQKLQQLRKQKGISQKELADALSVSVSAVSKWEHGNNFPDVSIIPEIAKILEASCDCLLDTEQVAGSRAVSVPADADKPPDREQGEDDPSPKRKRKICLIGVGIAAVVLLCLACALVVLKYQSKTNVAEPELVAERYLYDDFYDTKVYEMSFFVEDINELEYDFIDNHLELLKTNLEDEIDEDTGAIRIYYYDSREKANNWYDPESLVCDFLD